MGVEILLAHTTAEPMTSNRPRAFGLLLYDGYGIDQLPRVCDVPFYIFFYLLSPYQTYYNMLSYKVCLIGHTDIHKP